MKLPVVLKKLRAEKGLTQEDISNELKINRATYAHYETGRRQPDTGTLEMLAEYFNVSVDYLLGRTLKKSLYALNGEEVPVVLREIGIEYIEIAREMEQHQLSPEEIRKILEAVKNIKNNKNE